MDNEQTQTPTDVSNGVPAPTSHPEPYGFIQAPTTKRRWLLFLAGVLSGAAVVGAIWGISAAGSGSGSTASTFTLKGKMTLLGSCGGTGGYSDIAEGASVTVYGTTGAIAGNGSLSNEQSISSVGCSYDISVSDVPSGEKFYQVEVTHRGKVTFPADKAKAGDVSLSLGK